MKRFVWLLLLAFGTALAQVSPVEPLVAKTASCGCCEEQAGCDMPECPPPATAQPVCHLQDATRSVRLAAKPALPAPRGHREKFYVRFLPRSQPVPVLPVTWSMAAPASAPLFQEHCSWLI